MGVLAIAWDGVGEWRFITAAGKGNGRARAAGGGRAPGA
jgi:hypothetical protein